MVNHFSSSCCLCLSFIDVICILLRLISFILNLDSSRVHFFLSPFTLICILTARPGCATNRQTHVLTCSTGSVASSLVTRMRTNGQSPAQTHGSALVHLPSSFMYSSKFSVSFMFHVPTKASTMAAAVVERRRRGAEERERERDRGGEDPQLREGATE